MGSILQLVTLIIFKHWDKDTATNHGERERVMFGDFMVGHVLSVDDNGDDDDDFEVLEEVARALLVRQVLCHQAISPASFLCFV